MVVLPSCFPWFIQDIDGRPPVNRVWRDIDHIALASVGVYRFSWTFIFSAAHGELEVGFKWLCDSEAGTTPFQTFARPPKR